MSPTATILNPHRQATSRAAVTAEILWRSQRRTADTSTRTPARLPIGRPNRRIAHNELGSAGGAERSYGATAIFERRTRGARHGEERPDQGDRDDRDDRGHRRSSGRRCGEGLRVRGDRSTCARRSLGVVPSAAVHGDHGPVGIGKEHAHAVRRRTRSSHVGRGVHRRNGAVGSEQDRPHVASP